MRKYVAEFVGTLLLVFFAVGSAIAGLNTIGVVGVAFAFGLVLLALMYAVGPVSGCHVNPAVTLGMLLARRISVLSAVGYVLAQLAGGIAGAALLKLITSVGDVTDQTGNFGADAYGVGAGINGAGAFLLEIVLTMLLVFVVLMMTGKAAAPGFAGLAIGFTLTVVHLVGIPLDGTSVNPARALGPAIFSGTHALGQVWLFIVAPLVGGVLAALLWPLLRTSQDTPRTGLAAEVSVTSTERAVSQSRSAEHDVKEEGRSREETDTGRQGGQPPA
ncbi:MAG: aquaporin [Actinocatenispora sp.]